jgi:hypothetical protein
MPIVNSSTGTPTYTEDLTVGSGENQTDTLTQNDLLSGSLSISGLTVTNNYTVSYTTGVVTFVNGTTAGTYSAEYDYYTATYLDNASERTLMRVVILAFIVGLLFWLFMQFGLG